MRYMEPAGFHSETVPVSFSESKPISVHRDVETSRRTTPHAAACSRLLLLLLLKRFCMNDYAGRPITDKWKLIFMHPALY